MRVVGITGGIGSGKSYVARLLCQEFGVPVYDCDSQARRLMHTPELRRQITALIGQGAYAPDGSLNRPAVAAYLFADASHAAAVNGLVHPAVKADFQLWKASHTQDVVAVESAILVEAGFLDVVDVVLLVDAPLEVRIERAIRRDGSTREQVLSRIGHQLDSSSLRRYAHTVVVNDGRPILPQLRNFMAVMLGQSA